MCGCSTPRKVNGKPQSLYGSSGNFNKGVTVPSDAEATQMVLVEYVGPIEETFSIRSHIDRSINYRFGNNPYHKDKSVFLYDANILTSMLDGAGKPLYRVKGLSGLAENRDPTIIVGAIAA